MLGLMHNMEEWSNHLLVIKLLGPHLVPFFKMVAIYFVLADTESESWLTCLLKCLPIIWLCISLLLRGISLRSEHTYSRRILAGLIFSLIGDAYLVSSTSFLYGLASFSVAHVFYISAFGFKPLGLGAGILSAALGGTVYLVLYARLTGIMTMAVLMYMCLLCTMLWRSVARAEIQSDLWTWTKLSSCIGGILFTISDSLLGFHYFGFSVGLTAKQCHRVVMATYYAAQLCIALSTVENYTVQPEVNKENNTENKAQSHKRKRVAKAS